MRVAVLNRTVNLAAAATLIFNLHEGTTHGAPGAVQVADRWHLLRNIGDALERLFAHESAALRRASGEEPAPPAPPAPPA